jgi:hypothetical protein
MSLIIRLTLFELNFELTPLRYSLLTFALSPRLLIQFLSSIAMENRVLLALKICSRLNGLIISNFVLRAVYVHMHCIQIKNKGQEESCECC